MNVYRLEAEDSEEKPETAVPFVGKIIVSGNSIRTRGFPPVQVRGNWLVLARLSIFDA